MANEYTRRYLTEGFATLHANIRAECKAYRDHWASVHSSAAIRPLNGNQTRDWTRHIAARNRVNRLWRNV